MSVEVTTNMPGNIWRLLVTEGQRVSKGDALFVMEVMKTEVAHPAPVAGTVTAIHITEGDDVEGGTVAIVID